MSVNRLKVIKVPDGMVGKIAKAHGVSECMVYNALAMRTNSQRAQVIRKEAVELYGGAFVDSVIFA